VIIRKTARRQNRRLSTSRQRRRQHLLDVKVRARKASDQRTQKIFFGSCLFILAAAALGAALFETKNVVNGLFFANPDYAVKTIEVNVDGKLTREMVLQAAKLGEGVNIFSVSLPQVQERLAALPQVEESHIQRVLPDKISIAIRERRPVAWLMPEANAGSFNFDNGYLVDRRGILLKTKTLAPEYLGLPLIIGANLTGCLPGRPVDQDGVKAALEILRTTSEILPGRLQFQTIDISKNYALVATDRQHLSITFRPDQIEDQLRRLESILNYCEQNSKELQTVNLMPQRNIPVTYVQPATEPEASPVAPNPQADALSKTPADLNKIPEARKAEPNNAHKHRASKVRRALPVQKFGTNG
jgi:cell division septal protein FtsQ